MKIDASEVECFLAVAAELHFARAAARLGITPSRASQLIASFETRLATPVFERTTRKVTLTTEGQQLAETIGPAFASIHGALERTRRRSSQAPGTLIIGQQGLALSDLTAAIVAEFGALMPEWRTRTVELNFANQLRTLRDAAVDVALVRLPIHEDDITVGPIVIRESRALAVPVDHRLADRAEIGIEEIGDDFIFDLSDDAPDYWRDFHAPRATPAGRPLRRRREQVSNPLELLALIAAGRGVSPMVASMRDYYPRPDIHYVPITDLPPSELAVAWLKDRATPQALAFASAAAAVSERITGPVRPQDSE